MVKKVYPTFIVLVLVIGFLSLGVRFDDTPKIDRDATWMTVAKIKKIPPDVAEREKPEVKVWIHYSTPTEAICYVMRQAEEESGTIVEGFFYFEGDEPGWFAASMLSSDFGMVPPQ